LGSDRSTAGSLGDLAGHIRDRRRGYSAHVKGGDVSGEVRGGSVAAAMRFDQMNHRQGSSGGDEVCVYGGGVVRGEGRGLRSGGVSGGEVEQGSSKADGRQQ